MNAESAAVVIQDSRPSCAELVARARALQPLLHEHSAEGELRRRMPDAVIDALTTAGLFRLLTPARFGGYACDLRTLLSVAETLGEIDGSASWLTSIGATAAWTVSQLGSPQAQQDILGANPDARLAGSATPGTACRVGGGLLINGRWSYASGAYHADWALLTVTVANGPGQAIDGGMCAVPMNQLHVEQTWSSVGMRGTGSDTVVAENVFVPDHRVIPMSVIAGETPREADDHPPRLPFAPVATLVLVGPLLGLGRAALKHAVASATTKPLHNTFFPRQSESVGAQIQIAEAAVGLRTAQLHAYDIADTLDDAARNGQQVSYEVRAEIRSRVGYLSQQALTAISTLINVHGAGSFAESSRMQQYWRDANTAARHAALQPVVGYEVYGKALLGVAERISPIV
jgi:3-hydroxy-9,10-secoandrosta-1,3,5(10)-triene-9,17-dione monooxygenase